MEHFSVLLSLLNNQNRQGAEEEKAFAPASSDLRQLLVKRHFLLPASRRMHLKHGSACRVPELRCGNYLIDSP